MYDAVIVGAGPAGLSAALILGRCRRRVLLCDTGRPRNAASHAMHGYLTRDGVAPSDFLSLGRRDLEQYPTVELRQVAVIDAECTSDGRFGIVFESGERVRARTLLLATGVVDSIPDLPGFRELFGRSVFHCPYCDGWEVRDQPIAIYGQGDRGVGLALELTVWSRDLVLCTDGSADLPDADRERLARNGIVVREDRGAELEHVDGVLTHIVFEGASRLARRALFFNTGQTQRSNLAIKLGCEFSDKGTVRTGKYETTHLPGLYVAGDASRDVQWVVVAAAEGAEAAFAINTALLKEDLR